MSTNNLPLRTSGRMTLANGRPATAANAALAFRAQSKRLRYKGVIQWADFLTRDLRALGADFGEEDLYLAAAIDEIKRARQRIADRAALLAEMERTGLING